MGSRDYRHREPKKSKKETKKIDATIFTSQADEVKIIRKGKQASEPAQE